jgi:Tfp pilus assembly protein PilF
VEATRERELARQLSSRYEELERQAAADRAPVPHGLERVRTDMDTVRSLRPEQAIVNTAQREQQELATFHLDRGRRLFEREEDREAMAELRRAVYLSPYEAQAHLLIGRIYLRGGRPEEAIDALKISIWSEDTAPARVALAEAYLRVGKAPAARTELERALVLDPASEDAKRLLATLK